MKSDHQTGTAGDEEMPHEEEPITERKGLLCALRSYRLRDVFTWKLFKAIAMGQCLSALICGTAVTSQYLATDFQLDTPMLQSFLNYSLLCLTYTSLLICRRGDGNILQILKQKWWKYFLLGLVDVEANYTVVKAYQYTTLTSIQLLDCFVVPVLMVLSWFFLKTRYRPVHYVAVSTCLLGVGAMVGADLLAGRDQGSSANILLGDGLVLISATLYAVSNVCQEYTVKHLSRVEFLGMVGLFGTLISGTQMAILEHRALANIQWNWKLVLLLAGFALCMYLLYSFMPVVVRMTSATAVNLSMLTADLFSLFCGLFLFQYTFSVLYVVSLVVILVGFVMFNAVQTITINPPGEAEAPGADTGPEQGDHPYQGSGFEVTSTEPAYLGGCAGGGAGGDGGDRNCDPKCLAWRKLSYDQLPAEGEERGTRL